VDARPPGPPGLPFLLNEENTDVFAWFGQACALAQFLEASLLAFISVLPASSKARRRDETRQRAYLEGLSKQGLAALKRELGRFPALAEAAEGLGDLNTLRVELIHYWFTRSERIAKLDTDAGRRELIDELRGASDRLGNTAAAVAVVSLFVWLGRAWAASSKPEQPS
jgi:hypothetical protein